MLLFPDRQTPSRSEQNDTQHHSNNAVKQVKTSVCNCGTALLEKSMK